MSLRREVLIRILALLQRKTLIETKNRTLKCSKWHYSTVRAMKNVAVLTGDGAFFLSPPQGIWQLKSPHATPGNLPSKAKKMLMPGGGGAGGIDWCITFLYTIFDRKRTPSHTFYWQILPLSPTCQLKYEEYVTKPEHFLPGSSTFSQF